MNDLQIFSYQSHEVRKVEVNGEPWFVLKDVCSILNINNQSDVYNRLDDDEKGVAQIDTLGGQQKMSTVNESGLYHVILRSDKPEAVPFRKWVTSEVLPQIRKTGAYMVQADSSLPPELALADQTLTAVKKIYQMQISQGERLDKLEATKNIDHAQAQAIKKTKNVNIVDQLGGKTSQAYKTLSRKVFSEFWNDYYAAFGIQAYANTPAIRYEEALKYARTWQPCTNTKIEIEQANNQTSMFS